MSRYTSKYKLIVVLGIILVCSFLGTSIINYEVSRDSVRRELLHSALPLTRDTIYSEIHNSLIKPIFVSSSMANDTFLRDWAIAGEDEDSRVVRYLREIREKYGFFTTFFVSAETSNYYYYDGILKQINRQDRHDIWYYRFVASQMEYDLIVDTNEAANNILTIFINFRVEDYDGKLLGVTGVGVKVDIVSNLLANVQERFGRQIYLVNRAGVVQAHPDTSLVNKALLRDLIGENAPVGKILLTQDSAEEFEFQVDDREILLTSRFIPEFDWFLVVQQDLGNALGAARSNFIRTMGIGALSSLVILVLVVLTVNRFHSRLEQYATTDPLTGVANRRAFDTVFEEHKYRAENLAEPFSILLIDLDGLKPVNDRLGHIVGDDILEAVATTIRTVTASQGFVARWGGDEFIVLVTDTAEKALKLAETIRRAVENNDFTSTPAGQDTSPDDPRNSVTICAGVASYRQGESMSAITARADKALYKCKEAGKNRVLLAE